MLHPYRKSFLDFISSDQQLDTQWNPNYSYTEMDSFISCRPIGLNNKVNLCNNLSDLKYVAKMPNLNFTLREEHNDYIIISYDSMDDDQAYNYTLVYFEDYLIYVHQKSLDNGHNFTKKLSERYLDGKKYAANFIISDIENYSIIHLFPNEAHYFCKNIYKLEQFLYEKKRVAINQAS